MNFPTTPKQAAKIIEKLAAKEGLSVAQYCYKRGVDPSVITYWKTRNKSYHVSTFVRLIKRR